MGQRLAILGGGLLAQKLVLEAYRLGLEPFVFSGSHQDPALKVCRNWTQGEISETAKLKEFLKDKDYLTFESGFLPEETLKALEEIKGCEIFPRPASLRLLQKRSEHKKLLQKYKISTAEYFEIQKPEDLDVAWKKLKGAFILKSQRGSGEEVYRAKNMADLSHLATVVANSAEGFIAEPLLSAKREFSVIMVRNSKKEILSLPLMQFHQSEGWTAGPVAHPKFRALKTRLEKMLQGIQFVGVMNIKILEVGSSLFVSQLIPRVHGLGNYSQDALLLDQFALHLKAGLGDSLSLTPAKALAFASLALTADQTTSPATSEGHWHSQSHVNYLGKNVKAVLQTALKERKKFSSKKSEKT